MLKKCCAHNDDDDIENLGFQIGQGLYAKSYRNIQGRIKKKAFPLRRMPFRMKPGKTLSYRNHDRFPFTKEG